MKEILEILNEEDKKIVGLLLGKIEIGKINSSQDVKNPYAGSYESWGFFNSMEIDVHQELSLKELDILSALSVYLNQRISLHQFYIRRKIKSDKYRSELEDLNKRTASFISAVISDKI